MDLGQPGAIEVSPPRIIDVRSRPAYLHDFYGATPGSAGWHTARWLNRRVGARDELHFERSHTLEGFLDEIRAAGIEAATVIGRDTPGVATSNDEIVALVRGRASLIGIGSVDVLRHDAAGVAAEVERVAALGLAGLNLEPGFGAVPLAFDAPALWPAYETAQRLQLPVFLMSGPTTPDLAFNDPSAIGRVARRFPDLPLVVSHGAWPRVAEIVGVAFRYPNVHLAPDMYVFLPGSGPYVEAVNSFLADQFLFGTSFPFRPMKQTVDDFLALGIADAALPKVLFDNAARLLRRA